MIDNRGRQNQGLYDPAFEHDACGIGFIANIKGERSHTIVYQALDMLTRLTHRGGQGSDESGDGAGILTQIPHILFAEWGVQSGILLPPAGSYGVGMLFLPRNEEDRMAYEAAIERIIWQEGLTGLGWRTVPVNDDVLSPKGRASRPMIRQVFVGALGGAASKDDLAFERQLYIIRKRAEREIGSSARQSGNPFYFASMSARTIVYKGLVMPEHLSTFYLDLGNRHYQSALALVHSRYSTNTFPSWERAHPNRYAIHNGEINTIKGNVKWMQAREAKLASGMFPDMSKIRPIIDDNGSDSSMLDNGLEFLLLSGRSLPHAIMMMIPEPWAKDASMEKEKRAFYEYHSMLMEPWDGPAALAFSDGKQIAACLDRNGLRPARYYVTKDDRIILSSEVGVVDVPADRILYKERLRPGQLLLVDTEQGRIISDREIKASVASKQPYRQWLNQSLIELDNLPEGKTPLREPLDERTLLQLERQFGYTFEELNKVIRPLAEQGEDPVGSMGYDGPLAVLTDRPRLLYDYFKQMFAQVTNPPIDAFLEEMITSLEVTIGTEGNLLAPGPASCRRIRLQSPVISDEELGKIADQSLEGLKAEKLSLLFPVSEAPKGMEKALERLFREADEAIGNGAALLILSDRGAGRHHASIPALLAVSGLHHHLIRSGRRTEVSLLVESAEPREVHHIAALLGYGASAVNPYLVFASVGQMLEEHIITSVTYEEAVQNYIRGMNKGILKVIAKMGISTVQSYIGAQIFEAAGIDREVIDRYFVQTPSRIGGIGLTAIADEVLQRHAQAYADEDGGSYLESGDDFQWREGGEKHLFTPQTIHYLQQACRSNDYRLYKAYSEGADSEGESHSTLRSLFTFSTGLSPISIDEVEPVEEIMRRFKSGAMSFGSISKEAHETLAIAMNRIGGKSNSGEGGEDPRRYVRDENGDLRNSAIKQVASGRFGVTSHYLTNAEEIQIKMAQGAKPGEGGQLPAHKVYPSIAEVRGSTPGVELISPPPHHDIYSIEDLAELIYDLRCANSRASINVKLVSEAGVGTIAAGVAKANADVILISGYDGGTGAAARGSIKHTGMPWEIGLAEAHQTLMLNGLRGRVRLETDGKMMTGRDVVVAAMLGAEEFGFATLPLVAMGCIMMRVCHLDTCPVGIATQNEKLRAKFPGEPEHVENFMNFVAHEVREWMAKLGIRTINELVGRSDYLRMKELPRGGKVSTIDLSLLLARQEPLAGGREERYFVTPQEHGLDASLDRQKLIPLYRSALKGNNIERVQASLKIANTDRAVGTQLGGEVTRKFGAKGLPDHTLQFRFNGSAGQSFGAFLPRGISLRLEGDANDYVGKGLSGGHIAVYPPPDSAFAPEKNIIIGNVAFYGATSGEAYIHGVAGERFCVRNSGANVVVEGVGNHGCEYMTGGRVVILGEIGQNFGAGMSGGIAYVWNPSGQSIGLKCNLKLIDLEELDDPAEIAAVRGMIERHVEYTRSKHAKILLDDWSRAARQFVRIIPREYSRILQAVQSI